MCKKPADCFPEWPYYFELPPTMNEHSHGSTSSPAFSVHSALDFGHPNMYVDVVVPDWCLNLHFSEDV